ncbi:hypothetical protein [Streptomyces goshikiensis]|uniref:hypothetical protein n=1 Tax=Streptomyces goshikiensis TaxID=1942 RepID=UPI00365D031D
MSRSRTEPRAAQRPDSAVGTAAPAAVADAAGSTVVPAQGPVAVGGPVRDPQASVFASKADGGLGKPAQLTWSALKAAGREMAVEELCQAAGFAQRTVAKHLEGLAGHGLAVQGAGGGWAAAGVVQGLPEPRPGEPALVASVP